MSGYRLLPQLSPGRAFLWGSILALWGTAGLAMSTARHLDIHSVSHSEFWLSAVHSAHASAMNMPEACPQSLKSVPSISTLQLQHTLSVSLPAQCTDQLGPRDSNGGLCAHAPAAAMCDTSKHSRSVEPC